MAFAGQSPPSAGSARHTRKRCDAWTLPLWPVHLKLLPDELLSCWVVRLARAHGLKVQTFSRLLAGSGYHVWNRDLDRSAPPWLIDTLCRHTATPVALARKAMLRSYDGALYKTFRESGILSWVLPLNIRRFARTGFGLQFCPSCLAEDAEPYYRKYWRVAFYTWCPLHRIMLHDHCPRCAAPVDFLRRELGRPRLIDGGAIVNCSRCDLDLRTAPAVHPVFYDDSIRCEFESILGRLQGRSAWPGQDLRDYLGVLHHLCWMMLSRYRNVRPRQHACERLGIESPPFGRDSRALEQLPIAERHQIVQLGLWYMADLPRRLGAAWHDAAVTYSALLRDFDNRPAWYDDILRQFVDWRGRKRHHVRYGDGMEGAGMED